MNLIRFLLQRSPGLFVLAVVVGGLSGLANSALLMLINSAIHGTTLPIAADPRWLLLTF